MRLSRYVALARPSASIVFRPLCGRPSCGARNLYRPRLGRPQTFVTLSSSYSPLHPRRIDLWQGLLNLPQRTGGTFWTTTRRWTHSIFSCRRLPSNRDPAKSIRQLPIRPSPNRFGSVRSVAAAAPLLCLLTIACGLSLRRHLHVPSPTFPG
jgi:hypothetical protein